MENSSILHQQLLLYVVEKLDVIYITVIFFDVSAACLLYAHGRITCSRMGLNG